MPRWTLNPKGDLGRVCSHLRAEKSGVLAAPSTRLVRGGDVSDGDILHFKRVPGGYGVVINPGTPLGFEISPSGVGEILKDFADGPN